MSPSHRLRHFLVFAVPLALLAGLGIWYYSLQAHQQQQPRMGLPSAFLQNVLVVPTKLAAGFVDETGGLVAAPPKDPKDQIDPAKLVFAVLEDGRKDKKTEEKEEDKVRGRREKERFGDLAGHIAKATGKEVEIVVWEGSIPEQTAALRNGALHLAALSTGSVSTAVNNGGFVPFCVMGHADGKSDIHMEIIVPANSPMKSAADLKGKTIALASPHSHSGFKAPLVVLWKEFNLQPGLDYDAAIQRNQAAVVLGVADGTFKAGAVSSDFRQRMIDDGEIGKDATRVVYASSPYPPQCFGYAHQLKPELAGKIKEAFLSFDWKGTKLEGAFAGATKFVPISYAKDWEPVRQFEEIAGTFVQKAPAKK